MSSRKGIYSSDSQSMVFSDAPSSNGFTFNLELYLKECEEEEMRLMNEKNGKMPDNKGPSKKSHKVDQIGMETQKPIEMKVVTKKKHKLREFKSEVDPKSCAKGQKQLVNQSISVDDGRHWSEVDPKSCAKGQNQMVNKSISEDDRNWSSSKNQPRKVKSNKPGLPKEPSILSAPVVVTEESESGFKTKKTRLNFEKRRDMEKRHNLRILKLNQMNQIASKSTSQGIPIVKKANNCQSATELQGRKDFNIVFLTPRVRSLNKIKESEKVNQPQTNGNTSSDSSDGCSSKSRKFIMSKSELDLSIQQAVDEQFIKLKQEQQALQKLDRENEIKLKWTESKANFLMSPSVESFKSMIAIMPSVTKLVIKDPKSFIPYFKLFAFITLAIICIFCWIYEFGEPIGRIQNAFNDLFAHHSKPKKMGFFH